MEPFDPRGYDGLRMSPFRVRHTEDATPRMEDTWFGGRAGQGCRAGAGFRGTRPPGRGVT
ncbi:DUF6333 family protein [Kitasatospora camelliae]|uniref:DUF6333 family protein n=1 Tax=Kitasatospora camelliae TaxID=3156397 RepID=A0AAU8K565_9ACTN